MSCYDSRPPHARRHPVSRSGPRVSPGGVLVESSALSLEYVQLHGEVKLYVLRSYQPLGSEPDFYNFAAIGEYAE